MLLRHLQVQAVLQPLSMGSVPQYLDKVPPFSLSYLF